MFKKNKDSSSHGDTINQPKITYSSIIKNSLFNVASNTTTHALPNILRTENLIIKLFWIFLFALACGGSIYCNFKKIK